MWLLSDVVGIVAVAPLIIEVRQSLVKPPSRRDMIDGAVVLIALGALSTYVYSHPTESWISFEPEAFIFPLLLWLAARWPSPFAIFGAFVVSFAAMLTTIVGIGHLSDVLPLMERVHGVQTTVVMITVFTLVLVALFTERRRSEVTLKRSKDRLQLALDGADLGTFNADLITGQLECDDRAGRSHGHTIRPTTIKESRRFVHPDDLVRIDKTLKEAYRTGDSWNAEYRILHPPRHAHAGETRWITLEGSIVRDPEGKPVGLFGVTRDITDRKRTEDSLAERNAQLALAGRAALVGSYAYDVDTEKMTISEGYAAIHGFPEGTTQITRSQLQAGVHRDDIDKVEEVRRRTFLQREHEFSLEYRIVRPSGDVRWLEARTFVFYHNNGRPARVVGVNIDVTSRKRAEERQRVLVAELDHRVKNTLATVSSVISQTAVENGSVVSFVAALDGRIQSMARTQELLSANRWAGISVAELVQRELAPYAKDGNTDLSGPEIMLRAEAGQVMAMVVHELATNAAKHGSLSTPDGRVTVCWGQRSSGQRHALVFEWRETAGPCVAAPNKSGYGTSTIRDVIPYEFGGTVDLTFAASGVQCYIELPADWLSNDQRTIAMPHGRLGE